MSSPRFITWTNMIRFRQVTSAEVIDAHLARIDEVNPDVNAVTETRPGDRASWFE